MKHSKFKGVTRFRGVWRAQIWYDGRPIWLGDFPTEERAARAFDEAVIKYHVIRQLNFPLADYQPKWIGRSEDEEETELSSGSTLAWHRDPNPTPPRRRWNDDN